MGTDLRERLIAADIFMAKADLLLRQQKTAAAVDRVLQTASRADGYCIYVDPGNASLLDPFDWAAAPAYDPPCDCRMETDGYHPNYGRRECMDLHERWMPIRFEFAPHGVDTTGGYIHAAPYGCGAPGCACEPLFEGRKPAPERSALIHNTLLHSDRFGDNFDWYERAED